MSEHNALMAQINTQTDAILLKWAGYINENPALLSLLYDMNLLPEQIDNLQDAKHMAAFCLGFKVGKSTGD